MGASRSSKKNKSLVAFAKGIAQALSLVLAALALVDCAHSTGGAPPKTIQPEQLTLSGEKLPLSGRNYSPSWAPDGRHFLYVSKDREKHKNPQLYEWDVVSKLESRLTYSDGEIHEPFYLSDDEVIYLSNTDELKERPSFLYPNENKKIKTEIYSLHRESMEIQRLTFHAGYDGRMHPHVGFEGQFHYSSASDEGFSISKMGANKKSVLIYSANAKSPEEYLANKQQFIYLKEGHLFWSPTGLKSKPMETIPLPELEIEKISWIDTIAHPQSPQPDSVNILLISARLLNAKDNDGSQNYRVGFFDLSRQCWINILQKKGVNFTDPALSPDGLVLLYTSDEMSENTQIFMRTLKWDDLSCQPWLPPPPTKADSSP